MTEQELQALAALTGGKMFEGRLYLPIKTSEHRSDTCKLCVHEHRGGEFCGQFYRAPPVLSPWPCTVGPELTVWKEYKL